MKLSDAIVEPMPMSGICEIDVDKVVKCFPPTTSIIYNTNIGRNSWRLFNHRAKVKCTISEEDAREIIRRKDLVQHPSPIFANAGSYHIQDRRGHIDLTELDEQIAKQDDLKTRLAAHLREAIKPHLWESGYCSGTKGGEHIWIYLFESFVSKKDAANADGWKGYYYNVDPNDPDATEDDKFYGFCDGGIIDNHWVAICTTNFEDLTLEQLKRIVEFVNGYKFKKRKKDDSGYHNS